ncbi:hypothetical protein [Staphylococcus hyicus]|uniref:hypothetical protein n=1 Tax=Staphylococcus hyicus TaxID=1284 RepID=UPI00208F5A51|nr:hypothetical protein [Staphylococcus hyicus]MCO4332657.1 hypothetical protein [Staphylococcus hyicus]MCO4334375.1 hypothetical protein [Staphylococcus hyicus]
MARYEVLKSSKDKETNEVFHQGTTIDKTIKYINEHESKLEKAGYELPFFKRLEK